MHVKDEPLDTTPSDNNINNIPPSLTSTPIDGQQSSANDIQSETTNLVLQKACDPNERQSLEVNFPYLKQFCKRFSQAVPDENNQIYLNEKYNEVYNFLSCLPSPFQKSVDHANLESVFYISVRWGCSHLLEKCFSFFMNNINLMDSTVLLQLIQRMFPIKTKFYLFIPMFNSLVQHYSKKLIALLEDKTAFPEKLKSLHIARDLQLEIITAAWSSKWEEHRVDNDCNNPTSSQIDVPFSPEEIPLYTETAKDDKSQERNYTPSNLLLSPVDYSAPEETPQEACLSSATDHFVELDSCSRTSDEPPPRFFTSDGQNRDSISCTSNTKQVNAEDGVHVGTSRDLEERRYRKRRFSDRIKEASHSSNRSDMYTPRTSQKRSNKGSCIFCNGIKNHQPDDCFKIWHPEERLAKIRKDRDRCLKCLNLHSGACRLHTESCRYCEQYNHHHSICEHPAHYHYLDQVRFNVRW